MSCITENTIVIKASAENALKKDIDLAINDTYYRFRLQNVKKAFENDEYVVYIFDCNGDQPWEVADADYFSLDWGDVIAMETVYEDGRWTRYTDKDGVMQDTNRKLTTIMKNKLTEIEYENLCQNIMYSI